MRFYTPLVWVRLAAFPHVVCLSVHIQTVMLGVKNARRGWVYHACLRLPCTAATYAILTRGTTEMHLAMPRMRHQLPARMPTHSGIPVANEEQLCTLVCKQVQPRRDPSKEKPPKHVADRLKVTSKIARRTAARKA